MNTVIDNYVFAVSRGVIKLPHRTTTRFSTSTAADAGTQVNPPIGMPFTLDLTKYVPAELGQLTVNYHLDRIGRVVFLQSAGIRYWQPPYRFRFVVLDVEIMDSQAIPMACGHALGQAFEYSPAWVVRSRWTLQPVRF
jgi:hypothetical protein